MSDSRHEEQSTQPQRSWFGGSLASLPMKALTGGIVATLVFLTLISLGTSNAYRALEEVSTHELRLQSLVGRIVHLDELLTMSARMAAATGELRWERRYNHFAPELDAALSEAGRLATDSYARFAERTEAANRQLVEMEEQAFRLVRDGRREEAAEILFSEAYEEAKHVYAAGMRALTAAIAEHIRRDREGYGRQVFRAWALAIVSALLLLAAWLGVLGLIRRHLAERSRAEAEQRQLETRMQHAQKLESLGVLAGGIAHDFNNLLTMILGNCRIALADLAPSSPQHERLRRIRTAAEYAAELVQQILTYSGKPSVDLRPLDLSELTLEMQALLQASATGRCDFSIDCEGELPAVEADATQIRQVVLNLVTNACEAAKDPSTKVRLRTRCSYRSAGALRDALGSAETSGEYVVLEVADGGSGMDAGTRARIFEPFYTKKSFGRGLGLASVLGIVRAHSGALEVESQPERGTTVRVLLPLASRSIPEREPVGAEVPEPRGSGRILVVDDEEWVLEIAKAFLERAGFEATTALGGQRGVATFEEQDGAFDAVLVDLAMPDMRGDEVFSRLREISDSIPVVAVSGYNEDVAAERFSPRDFAAFVHKPYEPEDLVGAVLLAMGEPEETRG